MRDDFLRIDLVIGDKLIIVYILHQVNEII